MKLADLKARGAVGGRLVRKTIDWEHVDPESGEEFQDKFDVHVRVMSFGEVDRLFIGAVENMERSVKAEVISSAVLLGEEPHEKISYEDAYSLVPSLANKLMEAVNAVNRPSKSSIEEKKSPPPTSSGTS